MAQSKSSSKDDDKSLQCFICFSDFDQPKQLPCLHNFCLKCLNMYCEEENAGGMKPCPLCHIEFCIPAGGVEQLPNNQFITGLLVMKQASEAQKEPSKCDLCAEVGENVEAAAFCRECKQCLCLRCKKIHSAQTASKTHNVVGLDKKPSEEELLKTESGYCLTHLSKKIAFYCCDCNVLICYICQFESHGKHVCKLIKEVVEGKKEAFLNDECNVRKCHDESFFKVKNLKQEREKTLVQVSEAKLSIEEAFNNGVKLLAANRDKLLEDIEVVKARRLKEIDSQEDLDQMHCTELDSFLTSSRMVMERGTDCEIIRVANELHKRAEELIKSQDERNKLQLPWCIKFIPSSAPTEEEVERSLGEIFVADKSQWFLNSNVPISFKSIELKPDINGVTVLNNRMFVVNDGLPRIYVYDLNTGNVIKPAIKIPDMKEPRGIAGCSHNQALYISDMKLECIHKVNLTDNYVTRWSLGENYRPLGLSLTSEYNLLITVEINNTEGMSRVVEYTSEGQLIRDIELDDSIADAWQTIQLSSDRFIICHGWDSSLHRLCIINSEGQIIKISRGGELCKPRSITVDRNKDHVFVADSGNGRVLMFSRDFDFLGKVQTPEEELSEPRSVYFDSSTYRLFIGDWELGIVLMMG